MALNYTDNVVKISKTNYETLVAGGTVSGYSYDSHTIYLVLDEGGSGNYLPLSGGTMSGDIDMDGNGIQKSGDIIPESDLTYTLGTSTNAWDQIHARYIHLSGYDEDPHAESKDLGVLAFGDTEAKPAVYIGEFLDDELNIKADLIKFCASTGVTSYVRIDELDNKVYAPGGFFQSSDERLKNIHGELDLDKAYELIDKCSAIVYDLKDDAEHRQLIGVIAQEVKEFFPEIVSEDEQGFLSVDYAKLTVIILRVLKDLIDRVKKLEK